MKSVRRTIWLAHAKSNVVIAFLIIVAILSLYYTPKLVRKWANNNHRLLTPADYTNNPIEITIPVKFCLSVDMGLIITKIKNMQITCYTNRVQETDSTPNHTATGRIVYEGSCAVSQDLFRKTILPGDIIYIKSVDKYFIVEDTMNKKHKNAIDVFFYKEKLKELRKHKIWNKMTKSDVYIMRLRK